MSVIQEFLRYNRQTMLPEIGDSGQEKLKQARVLVIGAGGLGDIAYRYGYQRFDMQIMLAVIVVLIILVMLVQLAGDTLANQLDKRKI